MWLTEAEPHSHYEGEEFNLPCLILRCDMCQAVLQIDADVTGHWENKEDAADYATDDSFNGGESWLIEKRDGEVTRALCFECRQKFPHEHEFVDYQCVYCLEWTDDEEE